MDSNALPDRISTLILLLIAILTTIGSYMPEIQSAVSNIPEGYRLPAIIIALIIVAAVGLWSFYTSEQRSQNAYDQGLYEPVPPDTGANADTESTNEQ